jgi:recyclin-1
MLSSPTHANATTQFLASQNPALVKRTVLASFTNLLLLPVTIVPKTVGAMSGALVTGGTAAVQGIAMLNPQRWSGSNLPASGSEVRYSRTLSGNVTTLYEEAEDNDAHKPSVASNSRMSSFSLRFRFLVVQWRCCRSLG